MSTAAPLLRVEDLRVDFRTEDGTVHAVDGVSFEVRPGEVLAVVGESGCGKSVTAMTLMGLTRSPNAEISGRAQLAGTELISASDDELREIRGEKLAMIFQDPMTSMNPVYRVGDQIAEQILAHRDISSRFRPRRRAQAQAVNLGVRTTPDADNQVRAIDDW